jgi:endonuclease-3
MTNWRVSRELRQRAREFRTTPTPAEEHLWQRLRRRQVKGCYFRRQHPIGAYIADFCCVERRLVVEVDGPIHREQRGHDQEREEALEAEGYRVLRFTNEEIEQDIVRVVAEIGAACEGQPPIPTPATAPPALPLPPREGERGGVGGGNRGQAQTVLRIHDLLLTEYGDHPWHPRDPVASLVSTILSQNTNDVNRDRAFEQLRERFPTWEAVRDAPLDDLVDAIRPAGLGPTKAPRIQEALRRITDERGKISLDFLADWGVEKARAWLLSIPGVGPKTAAIVLLFALGKPAFPVDTHIHRVTRRLGLIPEKTSREKAHELLETLVPPDIYYLFHLNLIEHGRAVCHARNPAHDQCVLRDDCAYYQGVKGG